MNAAVDSDDGNAVLRGRAKLALGSWSNRLCTVMEEGQARGEIRLDVVPGNLATLIIGTLEGGLMLSRLQKKTEPLELACQHLEEYLESRVRIAQSAAPQEQP